MQKLMEEAMFHWAKEWAPKLLEREGWESPEAGELNQYLSICPPPRSPVALIMFQMVRSNEEMEHIP
jgi:hypothetical protein